VAVLNPFGSAFAYSSFLGGHELDRGTGIAVGAPGVIYLAGMTSSDGSLGAAAWNATLHGTLDGFAAKLLIGADLTVDVTDLLDPVVLVSGAGGIAHYRVDIKNLGGLSQALTATASIKANEPDSKPQNNQDKETTLIKK
jgi:hypothetical protein